MVLQISSSLDWRSFRSGDKPLQFVSQPYTSDIDHTGALSEAIVTLPQAVAPNSTIELEVAYEGVIVLDATRLTRIGTPEAAAHSSDWDQISAAFTAVRGAGYVAWYPIATEVANLSDGSSLFEVLGRWKTREASSKMDISLDYPSLPTAVPSFVLLCGGIQTQKGTEKGTAKSLSARCSYPTLGFSVPALVVADYKAVDQTSIIVYHLPGNEEAALSYADAANKTSPFITGWFGAPRRTAETADLESRDAAPFESGSLLLTPLTNTDSKLAGLAAAHQLTHAAFFSPRPWIDEGLAHFAQALYLEQQKGRQAALDYMGLHRAAFAEAAKTAVPRSEDEVNRSLVNTTNEELYRSKAMCVWWMLRDIVGEPALKKALAAYHPEQDKEPSYMPRLIAAQTQRDLEWFFDDWVYRDRGLPDFRVASAFPRQTLTEGYMITITVENLGGAGAEVPVTVRFKGGAVTKRLEVRAKSKGVIRVQVPTLAEQVIVNDGSVPESDMSNNTFKIGAADASK